ncbi:hypothetical protein ACOMHN_051387 [Nucella lapillus]
MAADAIVEVKDKHGNALCFGNMEDGLQVPPFFKIHDFRQHIRDIRQMEMNPGDVIIVGFPKSGSHWTYEIIHMLINGKVEYCSRKEEACSFLDMNPITEDIILPADRPRLFYTHLLLHHLPQQVREKKMKLVYLERNPKDALVSMYNHATCYSGRMGYHGSWDHFMDLSMGSGFWYGNWFDYVLNWEATIERETAAGLPVFVSPYEDLKKDPVGQICKLDDFLGYSRGRELCGRIADACQFSSLKEVKEKDMKEEMERVFKPGAVGFYRKGEVGDWKNWFTVAQSERFDQEFHARMQGSKLRYDFE